MASLGVKGITSSSFYAYVYNLDTSYSRDDRYIDWFLNGIWVANQPLAAYISESEPQLFSALNSGTTFAITATIYYTAYSDGWLESVSVYGQCTTLTARPASFRWLTQKISGEPFNLSDDEWNALWTSINAFRAYKGLFWYDYTPAYSGNEFTATMYNEAVYAISEMNVGYGTLYTTDSWGNKKYNTRSRGDQIYASYLNNLVSALNSVM